MQTQSWADGGTAHILPRERASASFSVERLTHVLDGGEEFTERRRWIQRSHEVAYAGAGESDRIGAVVEHSDASRSSVVAQSMKHFMDVHWKVRRSVRAD